MAYFCRISKVAFHSVFVVIIRSVGYCNLHNVVFDQTECRLLSKPRHAGLSPSLIRIAPIIRRLPWRSRVTWQSFIIRGDSIAFGSRKINSPLSVLVSFLISTDNNHLSKIKTFRIRSTWSTRAGPVHGAYVPVPCTPPNRYFYLIQHFLKYISLTVAI